MVAVALRQRTGGPEDDKVTEFPTCLIRGTGRQSDGDSTAQFITRLLNLGGEFDRISRSTDQISPKSSIRSQGLAREMGALPPRLSRPGANRDAPF